MPLVLGYRFDPAVMAELAERHRATWAMGSITAFISLMHNFDACKRDLSAMMKVADCRLGLRRRPPAEQQLVMAGGVDVERARGGRLCDEGRREPVHSRPGDERQVDGQHRHQGGSHQAQTGGCHRERTAPRGNLAGPLDAAGMSGVERPLRADDHKRPTGRHRRCQGRDGPVDQPLATDLQLSLVLAGEPGAAATGK